MDALNVVVYNRQNLLLGRKLEKVSLVDILDILEVELERWEEIGPWFGCQPETRDIIAKLYKYKYSWWAKNT